MIEYKVKSPDGKTIDILNMSDKVLNKIKSIVREQDTNKAILAFYVYSIEHFMMPEDIIKYLEEEEK